MRKYIRENTTAPVAQPAQPAAAAQGTGDNKLGSSAQKLQARLAKIPGLDELMSKITKQGDAAEILAAIAEKLGGNKAKGSKALTAAMGIAKKEENAPAPTAPAAQAPPATATGPNEARRRTAAFVRYLFE